MRKLLLCLLFPFLGVAQQTLDSVEQLLERKQYKEAEALIKPYVISNPRHIKSIEMLGDTYAHQAKWDDAIIQYKHLITLEPNQANNQYKYGGALGMKALEVNKISALMLVSDIENAFLKASQLDAKHIDARWALVEFYMQLPGIFGGSIKKSLEYANQLEALSKVDGYLAKGAIYEYDKKSELAEKYYKKAIQVGGSITCYEKLINFYEKQQQPKKAIAVLETSQKEHQRNAAYYQIGKLAAENNIQLKKGKSSLFIYLSRHTPEEKEPKAWANYRLAQIYKHENRKTEALKYIQLAIAELPMIEIFKKENRLIESD